VPPFVIDKITGSGSELSENPAKPAQIAEERRNLPAMVFCFSVPDATMRSGDRGGRKRRSLPMRSISPT
jgi:hypothetical protein